MEGQPWEEFGKRFCREHEEVERMSTGEKMMRKYLVSVRGRWEDFDELAKPHGDRSLGHIRGAYRISHIHATDEC